MPPSSRRTATPQNDRPRIMTPSTTAWPPYRPFPEPRGGAHSDTSSLLTADGNARESQAGPWTGTANEGSCRDYLFAVALRYFLLKRSTRPPVSTSFCLPV